MIMNHEVQISSKHKLNYDVLQVHLQRPKNYQFVAGQAIELLLVEREKKGPALDCNAFPPISLNNNTYQYDEMLFEKEIPVYSHCEHQFIPSVGKAHVAYFPTDKVIGLSKLNRVVKYFSPRQQVQERLTMAIADCLKEVLQTHDIAVVIEAKHFCVAAGGVEELNSAMVTSHLSARFNLRENEENFMRR